MFYANLTLGIGSEQIGYRPVLVIQNDLGKEKPAEYKQVSLIVDGCKVKMNFPPAQENTVISDIKRMMLGGVSTK